MAPGCIYSNYLPVLSFSFLALPQKRNKKGQGSQDRSAPAAVPAPPVMILHNLCFVKPA
jgi:hypothetical protein